MSFQDKIARLENEIWLLGEELSIRETEASFAREKEQACWIKPKVFESVQIERRCKDLEIQLAEAKHQLAQTTRQWRERGKPEDRSQQLKAPWENERTHERER